MLSVVRQKHLFSKDPQEESGLNYRKSYEAFFQSLLASAWIHGEEYLTSLATVSLLGWAQSSQLLEAIWNELHQSTTRTRSRIVTDKSLELFCSTDSTGNNPPSTSAFQPGHTMVSLIGAFDQINPIWWLSTYHTGFPFAHTLFLYSTKLTALMQDDSVCSDASLFAQSTLVTQCKMGSHFEQLPSQILCQLSAIPASSYPAADQLVPELSYCYFNLNTS